MPTRLCQTLARIVAGLCLGVIAVHAADMLYDTPSGGFTLIPPPGWVIKEEAGEAFPTLSGPPDDVRAPYVVIKEVTGEKDIYSLGDATMKEMLKDKRYQLNVRDAFETADQQFGLKYALTIIAPDAAGGAPYRQVYYFVDGPPGRIFAILATVPEAGWKLYAPVLDTMIRTYHLHPIPAPPPPPSASTPTLAPGKHN
jgi:hypothetical protein